MAASLLYGLRPACGQPEDLSVSYPTVAPAFPSLVSYEQRVGDRQELYLLDRVTGERVRLSPAAGAAEAPSDAGERAAAPGDLSSYAAYQGQLDWRPVLDRAGRQWFVFTSGAGGSGYDLYLSYVDANGRVAAAPPLRLAHVGDDFSPRWSPDGQQLVFVSADPATGGTNLYLQRNLRGILEDADVALFRPLPLTRGWPDELNPVWSPQGDHIAFQAVQPADAVANWGIAVVKLVGGAAGPPLSLTEEFDQTDETQPSWSPDGRFIAFYRSPVGEAAPAAAGARTALRQIDVAEVLRSSTSGGITGAQVGAGVFAERVVPHGHRGPAWQGAAPRLVYVQRGTDGSDRLVVGAVAPGLGAAGDHSPLPGTASGGMRYRDPAFSGCGTLVYVAAAGGAGTVEAVAPPEDEQRCTVPVDAPEVAPAWALVPGVRPLRQGRPLRGLVHVLATGAAAVVTTLSVDAYNAEVDGYDAILAQARRDAAANPATEAAGYFAAVEEAYDEVEGARSTLVVAAAALVGVYALGVLDGYLGKAPARTRPVYGAKRLQAARPAARPAVRPHLGIGRTAHAPAYRFGFRVTF